MSELLQDLKENRVYYKRLLDENADSRHSSSWGGNQDARYGALIPRELCGESTILEVGCGTGGYLKYLMNHDLVKNGGYCGIDILEKMQEINQELYPEYRFLTMDLLTQELHTQYDIVAMCGVFNIATPNSDEYMKALLKAGFKYCKKVMCFNFLSTYVNFTDEVLAYHDPSEMLRFCIENLSTKVELYHHYWKCDIVIRVYR